MLQYDLRSVHEYIRPDLEALIPELRTSAINIGDEIPTILDMLVIKHVLKPLARNLFRKCYFYLKEIRSKVFLIFYFINALSCFDNITGYIIMHSLVK